MVLVHSESGNNLFNCTEKLFPHPALVWTTRGNGGKKLFFWPELLSIWCTIWVYSKSQISVELNGVTRTFAFVVNHSLSGAGNIPKSSNWIQPTIWECLFVCLFPGKTSSTLSAKNIHRLFMLERIKSRYECENFSHRDAGKVILNVCCSWKTWTPWAMPVPSTHKHHQR